MSWVKWASPSRIRIPILIWRSSTPSAHGRKSWFYLKDQRIAGQRFGLAPFDPNAQVVRQSSWSNSLSASDSSLVAPLVQKIAALKDNLTSGKLISIFMGSRVQPLQHRVSPMWQYEGPKDLTRCSAEELTANGLLARVQHVTKCSTITKKGFVRPYASDRALPQVGVFTSRL